jgi:DNA replication protein DnaC
MSKVNLSDDDRAFLSRKDKILSDANVIGPNKYAELIGKKNSYELWNEKYPHEKPKQLTEVEKLRILQYETEKQISDQQKQQKSADYVKTIHHNIKKKVDTIPGVPLNKVTLYKGFRKAFLLHTGKEFVENTDTVKNIEAIIKYFAKDDSFKDCSRLVKSVDGVDLIASFNKGLLVVGDFGNGKSTIMKCMELMIDHNCKVAQELKWDNIHEWKAIRFKISNCHDLVSEYEWITENSGKEEFIRKYRSFCYCFDDVKKERIASNYGNINIMQTLFEKRYDGKKLTHGTCNYKEKLPGNLKAALGEFGAKYGGHIYDRLFLMYNIIEFKGVSFRK